MTLRVVIEPGEDGCFVASVPAMRGCLSQGATVEEARTNILEAIEGWLEAQNEMARPSSVGTVLSLSL